MTQALEEKIAHLTHTVDDLSDVMAKQDSELRRLTVLVDYLAQRARSRETDGGGGIILGDERPPHYQLPNLKYLNLDKLLKDLLPSKRLQGFSAHL